MSLRSTAPDPRSVRLGVYVDTVYRLQETADGQLLSTNSEALPFLRFVCEVGSSFEALILFGRRIRHEGTADHELPLGVELAPLPYYRDLRRSRAVIAAIAGTVKGMFRGLERVDAVCVFGPHPFALVLVALALVRGRRVVIGVRQDTMRYYRSRLPGRRWIPVLVPLWLLDRSYSLLARRLPTVVVGDYLARRYGGPRQGLLKARVSLVRATDVASGPAERDWSTPVRLLTVGRLEPEKAPLLAAETLAGLERSRPGSFRLTWVGAGRLAEAMRARAIELGVSHLLELPGFVPFGPELMRRYREAHLFVHFARTEAFGQVFMEAFSAATPVVATDVGGVSAALDGGRAGLLVPPGDADAMVSAVCRMTDETELRERCVSRGLELARRHTLESEAERMTRFVVGAEPDPGDATEAAAAD